MIFTGKEIKFLKKRTSKKYSVIMLSGAIFLSLIGIVNIYLAHRFSINAGITLLETIQTTFKGIILTETYSGVVLRAIDRFQTGVFQIAMGLVCFICAIFRNSTIKTDKKVLELVKSKLRMDPDIIQDSESRNQ